MRITQNYMAKNYMRNLNRNINQLSASNNRLSSQRKFNRVSEDPAAFARAYRIREQLQDNSDSLNRVRDGRNELAAAESNMMSVSSIISSAAENLTRASNGTISSEQREILAGELENLQREVLQVMNSKFGDRYLFSGSSNDTEPFVIKENESGVKTLFYNGTAVDSTSDKADFEENFKVYLDIGLGFKMENGKTVEASGFQISTSGIDMLGFGTTTKNQINMPNNILSLLSTAADAVREGDSNTIMTIHDHMIENSKNLSIAITDLGNRDSFLEYNEQKLTSNEIDLKSAQKNLEAVNLEEESVYNKMYEVAWTATLQLGTKILPSSIFDFMR